jgi:hypothetical protein
MAHCSAHVSDDVIRILTEARVRVIAFALHTTQVFQVVDGTLFGVFTRRLRCPRDKLPFDENNATLKVITKVYHEFRSTMTRINIWETFHAPGFECDTRRESCVLLSDDVNFMESARFEELCSVDLFPGQLSGRRRIARFGWIYKPELIDLASVPLCFADHGSEYLPSSENARSWIWRRPASGLIRIA